MKQSFLTASTSLTAVARTFMAALALCCASAVAADLPAPPAGLSAPPKATAMPAFDLPTTAGGVFRSESLRGQVVVVRYWASW